MGSSWQTSPWWPSPPTRWSHVRWGAFANLYGGVAVLCLMIFLLVSDGTSNLLEFNKWLFTTYSSVLWIALIALSIVKEELPGWLDDMKSWAVTFVAVTFFVIIHIDLEVPFTDQAWRWVVYTILAILQMLASVVVARTLPMVLGAIGAFVVAYKISWETVRLMSGGTWGGQLELLTMFAFMALQGIGIIVLAVWYASKRAEIETAILGNIRTWVGQRKSADVPVELPADKPERASPV